jgi:hypothetical protein
MREGEARAGPAQQPARGQLGDLLDGGNEAISALRHSLDVFWLLAIIPESGTQTLYSRIQPMVEVNKCVCRPQALP